MYFAGVSSRDTQQTKLHAMRGGARKLVVNTEPCSLTIDQASSTLPMNGPQPLHPPPSILIEDPVQRA